MNAAAVRARIIRDQQAGALDVDDILALELHVVDVTAAQPAEPGAACPTVAPGHSPKAAA